MYKYLEIVSIKTHKAVLRVDVTGKSERSIERTEMGMLMQMNREEYHTSETESETTLPTGTIKEEKV